MSKRLIITLLLSGVLLLTVLAVAMTMNVENKLNSGYSIVDDLQNDKSKTKAEAIEQAKSWSPPPDQICTMALTDAIHTETGAEYTFPSGCLAPGWEPAHQNQNSLR